MIDVLISEPLAIHPRLSVEVDRQTRVIVDLKDPSLRALIQEHIEAQYLERFSAQLSLVSQCDYLLLNQRPIHLHHFAANVCYLRLDVVDVDATLVLAQRIVERLERAFRPLVV